MPLRVGLRSSVLRDVRLLPLDGGRPRPPPARRARPRPPGRRGLRSGRTARDDRAAPRGGHDPTAGSGRPRPPVPRASGRPPERPACSGRPDRRVVPARRRRSAARDPDDPRIAAARTRLGRCSDGGFGPPLALAPRDSGRPLPAPRMSGRPVDRPAAGRPDQCVPRPGSARAIGGRPGRPGRTCLVRRRVAACAADLPLCSCRWRAVTLPVPVAIERDQTR